MKTQTTALATALVLAACCHAQLPSESAGVSGVLKIPGGAPATGPVDIEFRIYDSMAAGVLLWSELHPGVPLDLNGRYLVTLGGSTALTPALFANPDAWLTLEVDGDGEMAPRLPLGKAHAAFDSDLLDGSPPTAFTPVAELADQSPLTSPVDWLDLTGVPPGLADGIDDVDDADSDPANELNTGVTLLGDTLRITDAGGAVVADLSSLVDDADSDPTGELVTAVILNGTDLEIADAGGTHIADLSSLAVVNPIGPAAGDLTGTYPDPDLASDSIGSAEIVDGTVGVADLDLPSVDTRYANRTGDTITGDLLLERDLWVGMGSPSDDDVLDFHVASHLTVPYRHGVEWLDSYGGFRISAGVNTPVGFSANVPLSQPRAIYSRIGAGTPLFTAVNSSRDLFVRGSMEVGGRLALGGELEGAGLLLFDDPGSLNPPFTDRRFGWLPGLGMVLTGDLFVQGTLSKSGGTFKIDHPLDPANRYLSHSFVESPDMMNVYNGSVLLDDVGEAWVELPEYFEALNSDYRYQLSAIGAPGPDLHVAQKIQGRRFQIAGAAAGTKVSWQVTGIRRDPYATDHRVQVEVDKSEEERGVFLYPQGYGQAPEGLLPKSVTGGSAIPPAQQGSQR